MLYVDKGYQIYIDQVEKEQWLEIMQHFDDATIYQTLSYGVIRWGEKNLSHVFLKKKGKIVAASQARIVKFPGFNRGIAYIRWGPLWKLHGQERDPKILRQILRVLIQEYVNKRGLLLRIIPNEFESNDNTIQIIFENEGLRWKRTIYRTILLDLSYSMEQLRQNLSRNWRKQLIKAEKSRVKLIEGTSDNLYDAIIQIYNEMVRRKNFVPGININEYRFIQNDLPLDLKMKIMLCEFEGEPIAALIGSAIGNTGIELVAATGDKGLTLRGSYLLRWRMIQWLKEKGCQWYNLNGINPQGNPGVYRFKSGLSGKLGNDVKHIGVFEMSRSFLSSLMVYVGDKLKGTKKRRLNAQNLIKNKSHLS